MSTGTGATRRAFFWKAGAALAAPLAMAGPAAAMDDTAERLARLEDLESIRALHAGFLAALGRDHDAARAMFADPTQAQFDARVRALATASDAAPDIALAEDRMHARLSAACTARIETALAQNCTLAQMAALQGDGVLRSQEPRLLAMEFVKRDGAWKIARADYSAAQT